LVWRVRSYSSVGRANDC